MIGKKGVLFTWMSIFVALITLIVVPMVFYFMMSGGTRAVTNEIKEVDQEITEEYILNNYLRTKVNDMDFADLINLIYIDKENYQENKKLFEVETTELFDSVFGENNWQINLIKGEDIPIILGDIKGVRKSYETRLPTLDEGFVRVVLIT